MDAVLVMTCGWNHEWMVSLHPYNMTLRPQSFFRQSPKRPCHMRNAVNAGCRHLGHGSRATAHVRNLMCIYIAPNLTSRVGEGHNWVPLLKWTMENVRKLSGNHLEARESFPRSEILMAPMALCAAIKSGLQRVLTRSLHLNSALDLHCLYAPDVCLPSLCAKVK